MMGDFAKAFNQRQLIRHSLASIALIYGLILLAGAVLGNSDPLHPWETGASHPLLPVLATLITTVNTMTQFNQTLLAPKKKKSGDPRFLC